MDITKMGRFMLAENKALFPLAECVYSDWLSKGRAKKMKTSVVIAFSSPENTNRAIDLGLAWKGLRYNAELFDKNCKLLQCVKYLNSTLWTLRKPSSSARDLHDLCRSTLYQYVSPTPPPCHSTKTSMRLRRWPTYCFHITLPKASSPDLKAEKGGVKST